MKQEPLNRNRFSRDAIQLEK